MIKEGDTATGTLQEVIKLGLELSIARTNSGMYISV